MFSKNVEEEKRNVARNVAEANDREDEFDSSKMLDEKKDISDSDSISISCGNLENGGIACL